MAYISIFPKTAEAQRRLTEGCAGLMSILSGATKEVLDVPDHDIIVELNQCTVLAFNPQAVNTGAVPDVVIKIETSDLDLQSRFDVLRDEVLTRWNAEFQGLVKIELWISLIGAWGTNIDFSQ